LATTKSVMLWGGTDWLKAPPATGTSASRRMAFVASSCQT